ncbi:hypothetical protein D3C75_699300 [compost metagenome]
MLRLLHHGVVEADLRQPVVLAQHFLVVDGESQLHQQVDHIVELKSEYAAVPQGFFGNQRFSLLPAGLFGEAADHHDLRGVPAIRFGHHIAVLFRRIGGLHAHQRQVGAGGCHSTLQLLDFVEEAVLHIGVHRKDGYHLIQGHTLNGVQVNRRESNSREGIPALGLHNDGHLRANLALDHIHLASARGNGSVAGKTRTAHLPPYPLDHGLHAPLIILQHLQKLFGSCVIG